MATRFVVTGRVQGVGFRWFVRHAAERLGLSGHARNLPDGTVEVVVQGPADAVAQLETALRQGPPTATVTGVTRERIPDQAGADRFRTH